MSEANYQQLVEYKNQYGHVNVPQYYDENIGQRPLGMWVMNQRQGKGMTPERQSRLNDLDFVWNADEALWDANYQQLVEYNNQHGHVNVPRYYDQQNGQIALGTRLGRWVSNQRMSRDDSGKRGSFEFDWICLECT